MAITVECSQVASDARLHRSSQAMSVVGNRAVVFGGELVPRQPVDNKIDVINLGDDSASAVSTIPATDPAPAPRVGSPSTVLNGSVWIFSGRGGLEMKPLEEQGALWRYDVDQAQWELVKPADPSAPFPAGRSYHCIASDGVKSIYVHAGCPEAGRLSDLWVFDTVARSWAELPSAPPPARGGTSIAFADGKLYRINGFDGKTEQGGQLDVFDVQESSWSSVTYKPDGSEGPEPRSVGALLPVTVGVSRHLVTLFGERDPSSLGHAGAGKMRSDIWAFDVAASKWTKVAVTGGRPEARGWFDADTFQGADGNDVVVVHGGLNEQNERLGDVWTFRFV